VKIEGCNISTNLYTKPTDSHNYQYYDSAHPQTCKDSIPYSQFLRIRKICTHNTDLDRNVVELCKHFLRRKYPLEHLHQADLLNQSSAQDKNMQDELDKVFLITTYHSHDQFITDMARQNWDVLCRNQTTEFLHKRKLTCAFRRPKILEISSATPEYPISKVM